jgi:ketosteroid isomerase-like protein
MPDIAPEIIAQEEQLAHATRTLDLDQLDRLYADDIMMTSVLGETSRSKALILDEARRGTAMRQQAAEAGKPVTTTYTKEDLTILPLAESAVTTYRFVVDINGEGIHVRRRYRTTNIWARRHGRWQVVAAHTAFVLDPQQAAKLAGEPG